jgi:AAA ATPase domain
MPGQTVAGRDQGSRVPAVAAPAFTGRDPELAALAAALGTPPAVVLVEGEAGIGKTRLVREYLASRGRDEGPRVLMASCPPFRQPQTLGPVADAVRQAAGEVSGLGLRRRGGRWVRRELAELSVPPPVRDAVLERAGRLAPDARAVLEAAPAASLAGANGPRAVMRPRAVAPAQAGLSVLQGQTPSVSARAPSPAALPTMYVE